MDKYFTHVSVDAGSAPFWSKERKWERRHHRHQAKKACKEMAKVRNFDLIEDFEYHQSRVPNNTWYPADYLSPFYRWLEKNIGQPWDKIYSQFCKFTPRHNTRGDHMHSHLWADRGSFGAVYSNFTNVQTRLKNAYGFWYYIDDDGILQRFYKKWDASRWPSQKEKAQTQKELILWGGGLASHPVYKRSDGFYPLKRKMLDGYWGDLSRVDWIDNKAYYRQTRTKITEDDVMRLNSYDKSFHYIIKA